MAGINVLLVVESAQGSPGTRYLSWTTVERDGVLYDARMQSFPDISLALSHPRGGVQAAQDALTFSFTNMDGALSDWLDGTNDPRGYALRASYLPYGEGSPEHPDEGTDPVLFFEGIVADVQQSGDADGRILVTLSATSEASDKLAGNMPSVIIDTRTFNDEDEEDLVPEESLGFPVPVVYGATREHVPLHPIRRDPNNAEWRFVAMHDAPSLFLRGYVNTVYRLYGGDNPQLAVVPASEWKQWQQNYPEVTDIRPELDVICVSFSAFDPASVFFDGECTEFNTNRTAVKRHWLFRRSLADEKAAALLYPVSADALADWRFEDDLTDSSGNGNTLEVGSTESAGPYYEDEDSRELSRGVQQSHGQRFELTPVAADEGFLDFDKTTKFRIEVDLRANADGDVWRVTGPIIAKTDGTNGYLLEASDGYVTLKLFSSTGTASVTTSKRVKGDRMDSVCAYCDPDTDTIGILLNGVLQATASTLDVAAEPASAELVRLFRNAATGLRAQGVFGRVQVFDSLLDENYTWEVGQSNTVESAIKLASGVTLREYEETATDVDIDEAHGFTLLAWIKRAATPADEVILRRRDGTGPGFVLEVVGGCAKLTISDGTNHASVTGTVPLHSDDNWHLVIATFDRWSDDKTINLYVDGEPDGSADAGSVGDLSSEEVLEVLYHGSIDELMFERDALIPMPAITVKRYYGDARGNAARVIARLASDETWGPGFTLDGTSFLAAQNKMDDRGIMFAGALYEQRSASDVLSELCAAYGLTLRITGSAWGLFWFDALADGVAAEHAGYQDGLWNNVRAVTSHKRLPAKDIPKYLQCRFQRINDPAHPQRVFAAQTFVRAVSATATGKTVRIGLPMVRTGSVADRVADYLTKWTQNDEQLSVDADYELVGVNLGHPLWFSAPALGIATERLFKVISKRLLQERIQFNLIEDVDTSSYSPQPIYPDIVPQTDADYRYTEPPAPFDLHVVRNDPFVAGAVVGISFEIADDATTRAIVRQADIKFRYTDADTGELDEDEWTHRVVDVVPGETKQALLLLDAGRDAEIAVAALSRYDLLSATATTVAAGLTTSGGDNVLTLVTADHVTTVQRGETGFERRIAALEAGGGGGTQPYVREIPEQSGPYSDGERIVRIAHAYDHAVPADFGQSKFYLAGVPDSGAGDAVFTVKQNGVTVGTLTATDTMLVADPLVMDSAGYSATAGDFEIYAPSPPVAGVHGLRGTLVGTR